MHRYHVLAFLFILLGLAADTAVGQAFAQNRDVFTASSIQDAQTTTQTTMQTTASVTSLAATSSATPTTTMVDINTDISNSQPTLESSPRTTHNGTVDANGLPILPIITPATGLAGVLLIITGLTYSLVGIKNQWVHVFLSAAFLTSLSVTVLIEYVMSPPVSNAVQGAYFVAAFFTGIIFGALSLIFKELTEGLGCLLGGFCLSMWLLSLKQGGLLASSATRGIFIGAFCVAFYALSFSSYTRPYGLMVSTAFAGSTVAVLGIDCFSRAGWKEFWLYIWGLNDNLFPFGTSTYPVTRGIRVELAVAVVICLLGLLSQFRLWKLIRERRKKQEEALAEEKRRKDEAEMELGRAIEEKKENDLVRWEAMYGGSSNGESTAVQSPVSETQQAEWAAKELNEAPDNSVEMADLSASAQHTDKDKEIVEEEHQHEDDVHDAEKDAATREQSPEESPKELLKETACAAEFDADETPVTTHDDSKQTDGIDSGSSLQCPPPPPPCVPPLPFRVSYPENKTRNNDDDDSDSIQAIVDDVDSASVRMSKRLSAASLFRRLSHRNNANRRSRLQSESDEMLVPTSPVSDTSSNYGEADSEAGSLLEKSQSIKMDIHLHAAESTSTENHERAFPEDIRANEIPLAPSSHYTNKTKHVEAVAVDAVQSQTRPEDAPPIEDKTHTEIEQLEGDSGIVSERRRHTIDGTTSASTIKALSLAPVSSPPSKTLDAPSEKEAKVEKPAAPLSTSKSKSSVGQKENLTSDIVRKLPSHVSPVVMSYRTNEWAKHLSHADAPELESLADPAADTELPISPEDVEVAAPLNIEELKQTALTATPPPVNEKRTCHAEDVALTIIQRPASSLSKLSAGGINSRQSAEDQSVANVTTPPLKPASEVAAPTSPLLLQASSRSLPPPTSPTHAGLRSVSSPLLSTALSVAPIQKTEARHSAGQVIEEEPHSLMAQRQKMVQARLSAMSLTRESWAPRNKSRQSIAGEGHYQPRPGSQLSLVEDDDMPLTQRRALLQQNATSPPLLGMDPEVRRSPVDRHRLSRESSKQKVATMAAWRESLQEDFLKPGPLHEVDIAQNELMEQQRKAQVARSQRIMASENLGNSIAERMRHGDMQDLHREAMRRMQATANRKAMNNSP